MNELTKKDKVELTFAEKLDLIRNRKNRPALLLDCSGSMSSELEPGNSKINALRTIALGLPLAGVDIYKFDSSVTKVPFDRIKSALQASGGTNMAAAFQACKVDGHNTAIVITDGQPDSAEQALAASKDLKLEIIYVGSGQRPDFLDRLAQQSGGHSFTGSLKETKELGKKIMGLLGSGSEDDKDKRGPICL